MSAVSANIVSLRHFVYGLPFLLLILVVSGMVGCSSTSTVVYPSSEQPKDVQRVTQRGFDFLHSDKSNSRVTVSLQSATSNYASLYVSIANKRGGVSSVDPSSFIVTAKRVGASEETYSAYSPEKVSGLLAGDVKAQSNVVPTMSYYANLNNGQVLSGKGGQTVYSRSIDRDGESGGTGAYGSSTSENGRNLEVQELLLQKQLVGPGNVTDGLVYSPFTETATGMNISITIGAETHTFSYDIIEESR